MGHFIKGFCKIHDDYIGLNEYFGYLIVRHVVRKRLVVFHKSERA